MKNLPTMIKIRPACVADHDAIWSILEPVIRAGETYALPTNMSRSDVLAYWTGPDRKSYVALSDTNQPIGTYYLRQNNLGGGSHVCNCGYMTSAHSRRGGVARAMCKHSIETARADGFAAMQFNFVVSTNEGAIHLWRSLDFAVVGRIPKAFDHPRHGLVDALVMHRFLE